MRNAAAVLVLCVTMPAGCGAQDERAAEAANESSADRAAVEAALAETLQRARALADAVEDTLRPLPLMRPAEEAALRRYDNAAQLARARRLGVRATDTAELASLRAAGRIVPLEDSTRYWIVRELDASHALVTPDVVALLERIGERFHARLADMGLPPFRLEVTSALRTAADQAALRGTNINAAAGTSTHEYGTTVDVAYSAYAPPAELPDHLLPDDAPAWLRPYLERAAAIQLEAVAARKSRELMAVLGDVLRELQSDGLVMVTLERLQPVYHMTVARRLAEGRTRP